MDKKGESPQNKKPRKSITGDSKVDTKGVLPKSDVVIPSTRTQTRPASALKRDVAVSQLKNIASLKDSPDNKRDMIYQQKLELCSIIFPFNEDSSEADPELAAKELKRAALMELVEYLNDPNSAKILTDINLPKTVSMIKANIIRSFPPRLRDFDPEEDEPVLTPSWPHLQIVYEFLLRFIVHTAVQAKTAKKYIDSDFCSKLIELFDSEDPRERDYLKIILHRIYGKFMVHRSCIRIEIQNVFYRFIYETERHNGIAELLEILGSIINGFALPLKLEHTRFLSRALITLHKPSGIGMYQQQLTYCICQYIEKDKSTAVTIINGLIKYWPWSCAMKQMLFLNELEEILELLGPEQIETIYKPLFKCLARCLGNSHFQITERTLFLWNNESLNSKGCLSRQYSNLSLPIIYSSLYNASQGHWNASVEALAKNVLKIYMDHDEENFLKVGSENAKHKAHQASQREKIEKGLSEL